MVHDPSSGPVCPWQSTALVGGALHLSHGTTARVESSSFTDTRALEVSQNLELSDAGLYDNEEGRGLGLTAWLLPWCVLGLGGE